MPRGSISRAKAKNAEAEKENADGAGEAVEMGISETALMPAKAGNSKAKTSSRQQAALADELDAMTKKMNMICLEKEKAESLLKQRDAQLEEKHLEELRLQGLLNAKDEEQKKLAEKVRKLQKIKEFQPTIDIPINDAARGKDVKAKKDAASVVKRPLSPFLQWAKEQRTQIRKEHPEAGFAEISKILGERWKTVSEEEKKPYEERYQVEKEVYLKIIGKEKRDTEALKVFQEEQNKKAAVDLLEQYLQYKSERATEEDGKKKKKEKDPNKPKKPTSAFFLFSNDRRPRLLTENMKVPEISKKLGEEWKSLDEASRQPYEKVAAFDKLRYGRELEAYKLKKAGEIEEAEEQSKEQTLINKVQGLQLLKQREQIDQAKKNMKEQKQKNKRAKADSADENKPKKPPTSYILFVMENRKLIQQEKPGASFSEVTATLAVRWQELPEAEKQVWAEKAAAAREQYKVAMEEFKNRQAPGATELAVN